MKTYTLNKIGLKGATGLQFCSITLMLNIHKGLYFLLKSLSNNKLYSFVSHEGTAN